MKSLLASLVFFSIATACSGVGNREIGDLTVLRRVGFEFTGISAPDGDTISFDLKMPAEFLVAEDIGTKPFARISLVEFTVPFKPGPNRIGAHSSEEVLKSRKSAGGHDVARVTVRLSKLEKSHLMISFVHPGESQWPLLVHVPLAALVKQLEAEKAIAPERSLPPSDSTLDPQSKPRSWSGVSGSDISPGEGKK